VGAIPLLLKASTCSLPSTSQLHGGQVPWKQLNNFNTQLVTNPAEDLGALFVSNVQTNLVKWKFIDLKRIFSK